MKRGIASKLAGFTLFVLAVGGCLWAQDPNDIQQGIKAYGAYQTGDIDSVSITNGNVVVNIPLVSYPQRGKVGLGYKLIYNGKNYKQRVMCIAGDCTTYVDRFVLGSPIVAVSNQGFSVKQTVTQDAGNSNLEFTWNSLVSPDGASHIVAAISSTDSESIDGTGLHFHAPVSGSQFPIDANGTRLSASATQFSEEDTNGNQINISSGEVDTVGRTVAFPPRTGSSGAGNCPTGPLPVDTNAQWTVPGPSGGNSTFLFCWALVNVVKTFDVTDGTQITKNFDFLQSVVLPNGTAWTFKYSTDGFGDLTGITFPTGGTITYVWESGPSCTGMLILPRWLASRTKNANDGTGNHTWTYTYSGTTTVSDPLGNNTVYTNGAGSGCNPYTTLVEYYQGTAQSSNLVKSVATAYNQTASPFSQYLGTDFMNIVPTQITTTWYSSGQAVKTSQTTETYDSGFTFPSPRPNDNTQYTGLYGKVVAGKEYDYGPGTSAGPLLRQTNTSYAWQSPNPNSSTYLSNNMLNLVYSTQVTDGTNQKAYTQYGYDETATIASGMGTSQNLDTSVWTGSLRGNQTSVNRWLNLPSAQTITTKATFYDTGMPSVAKDPLLNSTTYFYSSTFQDAYVTQAENALSQSVYYNYDYNTGLKTSATDLNGLVTSYSFDSMWRILQANHPDNGQDTISRQEASPPFTATLTSTINTSQNQTPLGVFDGLGRVSQSQLTSDPQGIVYTDTTYDGLGHVATVSNPYRTGTDATSSPQGTVTTYTYDALGRNTKETYPDGSALTTAYCGPSTLVTDPTGKWRRSRVNGLGQLVEVDEPNAVGASVASTGCPGTGEPIWVTSYTNDLLGNLTQAVQNGSHTRTFTYDSLSRLLTSSNPETGQIAYTYDADGNVLTKKDARNITTNYSPSGHLIDVLNRVTGISYSNGDPSLTFTYDGTGCLSLSACQNIGHRTGMTDGAGSESWAYQVDKTNSRSIHREQRTTKSSPNNITKTTTYYLDLAGNVTQIVYPTGRTVNYTNDSANRPSSATDASNGITYVADWKTPPLNTTCTAGAVCYTPQGSVYGVSIGQSSSFTGFNISESYNSRLQPSEIKASSSAGNAIDITYNFVDPVSTHNAGHVYGITNNLNSSRSQAFTYDQVNRILSAGTTATTGTYCWGYHYSYDAWGNLLAQAGWSPTYNACTETTMGTVTANGNNQISGLSYDASGNTLGDGNYSYTWDGESQMKTAAGLTYAYDGDGRRAAKVGSKLYWYGSGGAILAETDAAGNTLNEYVFFGGKRVAVVPASASALYYAEDLLGSSRVIVQSNGTLCYDADFTPFGGEKSYTSTCPQNYKFEGKERDTETQNDDFGARYYTWRFGRWLSSDWSAVPLAVPYANLTNPQTLNLYAMAGDDPESFADLDGHQGGPGQPGSGACPPPGVICTVDAGGGRLDEKIVDGRGGDAPTLVSQLEPDSVLSARGAAFMEWALATGNAGPGEAQNSGEGRQANLDRRQGIADAATDAKQRADLGQKQYGPNQCSAFVAACISKAGADAKFTPNDGPARPPVAGEWANKNADIPGWRVLGPKEGPEPGDVAAVHILNPHFAATGDSAIVVRRGNGLSAIQAGDHGVGYNSKFIHGYEGVVYRRYTGD